LPTAQQVGLPTGWTILSNNGSQIRICNSADAIPVSTSRIIVLKAQGVTVTPPQTFSGNINFGNGTTCAAGTSVAGDLTTDNSATSTIEVIAAPLLTITNALTPFSTTSSVPSTKQSFTLSGANITEDIIVTARTGFEVSNTSGSGFASTATVTPIGAILTNYPVYIRLSATAPVGSVSGNVVSASVSPTCVTPQNFLITGDVTANPLSIQLINFSLKADNCNVNLNWVSSFETNAEKFEIQKSERSNMQWKTIGKVMTTSNQQTYNYKDENIFSASNLFYRLKMIEKDGTFTFSQALNALVNCNEQSITVFPNPVINGILNVNLNSNKTVIANLTSLTGQ
jgi:hypothetical protein